MPRLPRYSIPGQPQHVIQRGNNRSLIFKAADEFQFFRECLRSARDRSGCQIHAYVFMTNHVHLLVTPDTERAIGRALQTLASRYVRRFNLIYQRTGHLWGGRYHAAVINTEQYLFTCHRYIELNPVRAGLASHARDYPWSSYRANALGVSDRLVTPHERYVALGRSASAQQVAYRALFSEELTDSTLAEIRDSTKRGWALGSKRFRDEIAAHLRRRKPHANPVVTETRGPAATMVPLGV